LAVKVKGIAPMLSLAALILTAGCDPAVTVRQGSTLRRPVTGSMLAQPDLMVRVTKYRRLVGSGSYSPEIKVTNISDSPITVTSVALVTRRGSFLNSPRRPQSFPVTLPPGATGSIDAWFDLREGIQRTFRKPAELRVHYRSAGGDSTARVRLVVAQ